MQILEKAIKILQQPVCDHCLGRQFAQLLSGYTNEERGRALRTAVAMAIDKSREEKKESPASSISFTDGLDMSNFWDLQFHNLGRDRAESRKKCSVCFDLFSGLKRWSEKIAKSARSYEIKTFLIGTKLPLEMISAEEHLWERAGIDFCEPIKAEINRELGKLVETRLGIRFSKTPDVNFIVNFADGKVDVEINPVFVYGEYQKLVRGIPQTKWPSRKYKTSVEEIIAKPFIAVTKAAGHKLHGLGREDIDARCLGWRPFVLELLQPKNRTLALPKLEKKVSSGVKVRKMRPSSIAEVRRIKEVKADKTYSVVVECERKVTKTDLRRLKSLKQIKQKTPERVLHRRADKFRNRGIKSIRTKILGPKKFQLIVKCEAGLYVKELVHGDSGRTEPSVSQLLNARCTPRDLDVLQIHARF